MRLIVTTQLPVPKHAPDQPVNIEPDFADAVRVTTVPMAPGTLMFFEGRASLHRVTPIEGPTPRYVALLAYDTQPGTCSSELLRLVRYGRAEARTL